MSDGDVTVGVTNLDTVAHNVNVTFANLGWKSNDRAAVRDLWSRRALDAAEGHLVVLGVQPHDTVVLRLSHTAGMGL